MNTPTRESWLDRVRGDLRGVPSEKSQGESSHCSRIGKYLIRREIARGGMGIVFEAEDPILKRRIALKVIREGDVSSRVVDRLHREARIAGRLQHPNIVAVHEVGTVRDPRGRKVHFIALEYVDGITLSEALSDSRLFRAQRLRLMLELARAVSYAHSMGIVHRDLKPSNVLIDRAGRVRLTDFGLAHGEGCGPRLTRTQALLGTPPYMAPEQIAGHTREIDARSDVYALGVMLYEMVAGRLPFQGSTIADLCFQILSQEPPSLRRLARDVDRDLEAVCLRAIEKERTRRYPSGAEFARDLERYLNGRPVVARPPGLLDRLRKSAARRKGILWTAIAGVLVAGFLLFRVTAVAERAERSRTLAQEQLRKRTGAALKAALELRRAGNLEAMEWFERETEEACRQATAELPASAEPHYRLGRMYRARMKDDAAWIEQEAALRKEPGYGPALYERIVLTAKRIRLRVAALVTSAWREEGRRLDGPEGFQAEVAGASLRAVERVRSDSDVRSLRAAMKRDLDGLPGTIHPAEMECARGLLAWIQGQTGDARARLSKASREQPTLEEAFEALANLEWEAGKFPDSAHWCEAGIEQDRGYLPHREARSRALWAHGLSEAWAGGSPEPHYAVAVDDLTFVIDRAAARVWPRWWRGQVRLDWGRYRESLGGDPSELYEAARDDFSQGIERSPDSVECRAGRGEVRRRIARLRIEGGRDPTAELREAVKDLTLLPEDPELLLLRGLTHGTHAVWIAMQGEDPSEAYRRALEDVDAATARNPESDFAWTVRGSLLGDRTQFEEAVRSFDRALSLSRPPLRPTILLLRATVRANWGMSRMVQSADPVPQYAAALEDCGEALKLNPLPAAPWTTRARVKVLWGNYELLRSRDPTPYFEGTLADAGESLQRVRSRELPWILCATARAGQAVWAATKGGDPLPHFEEALDDLERAFAIRRSNAETWEARGKLRFLRGEYVRSLGKDPREDYRAALADYEEAIRIDRSYAATLRPPMEECRRRLAESP